MCPATLRKLFLRPTFPVELTLHRLDSLASSGKLDNAEFLESKFAEFQDQPELQKPLVDGGDLIALGQAAEEKPRLKPRILKSIKFGMFGEKLSIAEKFRVFSKSVVKIITVNF